MKKAIKIIFLCLLVLGCLSASACGNKKTTRLATIVYSEYSEKYERDYLMVLAPSATGEDLAIINVDGAVLPEANGVFGDNGENVEIAVGDVIIMEFDKNLYVRQDTTPKVFIDGPCSTKVVARNVGLVKVDNGFKLSLPLSLVKRSNVVVGENINFYSNEQNLKNGEKATYSAIIEDISNETATCFVESGKMFVVINCLSNLLIA